MRIRQITNEAVNKTEWTFFHGTKSKGFDSFAPAQAAKGEQYWNPLGNGMYATNNPRFAARFGSYVHKVIIPPGHTYLRVNMDRWRGTGMRICRTALRRAFKANGTTMELWTNGTKGDVPNIRKMTREQMIEYLVDYHTKTGMTEEVVRERAAAVDDAKLRGYCEHVVSQTPRIVDREKQKTVQQFFYDVSDLLRTHSPYESLFESHSLAYVLFPENIAQSYSDILPVVSDEVFGKKYDFVVFTETNDVMGMEDKNGNLISSYEVVIFNPKLQKVVADNDRYWM